MKALPLGASLAIAALCAHPIHAEAAGLSAQGFETSFPEILLLERLNAAVRYDPAPLIEADWAGTYDRVAVVELASTQSRYALFEDDAARRVDVAIRGTANMRNTAFDLEFLKKRSEKLGIFLHSGFEKSAAAIYEDLRPRLKEGYSIRLAGHSLGAAEAIILGMLLTSDGYSVDKVLASAPPKVTDAEGWKRFAALRVLRVVGPFDPVPFLPPAGLLYGKDPYIQGGRLILLLDGEAFTIREGEDYDHLTEGVRQAFAEGKSLSVADHLLPAYLGLLLPKAKASVLVDEAEWEARATKADQRGEIKGW
jgi:triacylglycerol lipase